LIEVNRLAISQCGNSGNWTQTGPAANRSFDHLRRDFRATFSLLILINRAASSYQLLDLNLAVFPLDRLFLIADLLSFEVDVLVSSFLDNFLPLINRPNSTSSFDHLVGAAECGEAVERLQMRTRNSCAIDSSLVRPEARRQRLLD
jgi:hypothetical protein